MVHNGASRRDPCPEMSRNPSSRISCSSPMVSHGPHGIRGRTAGTDPARQPGRADHRHRGDRQHQRNAKQADNASAIAITTPTGTATPSRAPAHHGTRTEPRPKKAPVTARATTPAPAATAPAPAATAPAPAATAPAASGSGHYTCGLPPAEQRRHLLRTRQILPRCRPWDIRDSWRWGRDHRRRQ